MMPELRRDPLHHAWVAFSPERQRRPQDFNPATIRADALDPFAPGNERLTPPEVYAIRAENSQPNGPGWSIRVVPNRYPAMRIEGNLRATPDGLYDHMTGVGAHEVVIETESNLELEELPVNNVAQVLATYRERILDLDRDHRFQLIYIFKNVGQSAGASLLHAHSQLVALPLIPAAIEGKLARAREHYLRTQRSLFTDILHSERTAKIRVVVENSDFLLFCPYASRFPFELAIYPKRHHPDFISCTPAEMLSLAEILRYGLQRLNHVLDAPGYNLLLHTAPLRRPSTEHFFSSTRYDYCWHLEIAPRFNAIAGFEIGLGAYINTVYPEDAARALRGEGAPA